MRRVVPSGRLIAAVVGIVALLMAIGTPLAAAHPLGNFTVNHHIGLVITPAGIDVTRIVDMAEIPAFQTIREIDADDSGAADEAELMTWADSTCVTYLQGLEIEVDGVRTPLDADDSAIALVAGEGGLDTLRLTCRSAIDLAAIDPPLGQPADGIVIDVVDATVDDRLGWREIVATGDGVQLAGDALRSSPTAALTDYTTGAVDPAMRSAHIESSGRGAGPVAGVGTSAAGPVGGAADPSRSEAAGRPLGSGGIVGAIGNVISSGSLGLSALGIGVAGAFALGLVHAMAPGHGKTLMAAYLVGRRGTRRQAAVLGVSVAVSHTIGVAVLGLVTVAASSAFEPERVYPYLTAASAVIVLVIGVGLVVRTVLPHRHSHQHAHGTQTDRTHAHVPDGQPHGHDDGAHDHDHSHGPHHSHGTLADGPHHTGRPETTSHGHTHGDRWWQHRHVVPDADTGVDGGSVPGWRGLAALGLSGGLVPSASAVVVFLAALNLGRIELGLVLVAAFGVGMATALIGVGMFVVAASRRGASMLSKQGRFAPLVAALPVLGALGVLIIGIALTVSSVSALTA